MVLLGAVGAAPGLATAPGVAGGAVGWLFGKLPDVCCDAGTCEDG